MRRRCSRRSNSRPPAANIVLLTRVGGGAFGNADEWIDDAIVRAVAIIVLNLCLDAGPAGASVMSVTSVAAAGALCEMPAS